MSAVVTFDFDDFPFRVMMRDHEPWFIAKDVCRVLEISDYLQAVDRLDDDERGRYNVPTPGGNQEMVIISESGLYALILTSRKPEAKRFRKWVTAEVLPKIRTTGRYEMARPGGAPVEARPRWRFHDHNIDDIKLCVSMLRETRIAHGREAAKKLWGNLAPPLPSLDDLRGGLVGLNDNVHRFTERCFRAAPGNRLRAYKAYDAYTAFCAEIGEEAVSLKSFGGRLAVLGFEKVKRGGVYYLDVDLVGGGSTPAPI